MELEKAEPQPVEPARQRMSMIQTGGNDFKDELIDFKEENELRKKLEDEMKKELEEALRKNVLLPLFRRKATPLRSPAGRGWCWEWPPSTTSSSGSPPP